MPSAHDAIAANALQSHLAFQGEAVTYQAKPGATEQSLTGIVSPETRVEEMDTSGRKLKRSRSVMFAASDLPTFAQQGLITIGGVAWDIVGGSVSGSAVIVEIVRKETIKKESALHPTRGGR